MTDLAVYRLAVPEGFEWILPVDDDDFETFQRFDGTRRGSSWKPIPVKVLRSNDQGEPRRRADLPWLGRHVLVLTARATHVLGERLQEFGELLPLSCVDAELFVYNPLHVIDALDEDRSELVRFTSGRVMQITRHVFRPEAIDGVPIFKIPQLLRGSIFVLAELVQAVEAAGLQGTEFKQVWVGSTGAAEFDLAKRRTDSRKYSRRDE